MKPLSLNLSKVKKIGGDQHSSTFMHPDGHKFMIAHSGISALQRKQIEKMPTHHFAEGGEAQQEPGEFEDMVSSLNPFPTNDPSQLQAAHEQAMASLPKSPEEAASMSAPAPEEAPAQQAPAEAPDAQAPGPQGSAPAVDLTGSYNLGQHAIREQQAVSSQQAQDNQKIQEQDLASREALNKDAENSTKAILAQREHFMNDYMANHVNPNHYVENMSTGQKVATGIGLLLGGFSSGLTGRANPAQDFLNKQIDRDISAQESRLGQQKTLLGANEAMFRDKTVALQMTRINMNDIYNRKIQIEASKLGTPQAKANADAMSAQFAMKNAQLMQSVSMRSALNKRLQQGGQGITAIDLAKAGYIPEQHAVKEQASIDAQNLAIQKTQELFKALRKEQTAGNLMNPQSYARVKAIKAELVNAVMNASASKRLTHESIQAEINPLLTGTFSSDKTGKTQEQGMLNIIQRHADPTPYMKQYAPAALPQYGQPEYKIVGGVKYMRGPKGEAIRVK